jgi:hypothetical protein
MSRTPRAHLQYVPSSVSSNDWRYPCGRRMHARQIRCNPLLCASTSEGSHLRGATVPRRIRRIMASSILPGHRRGWWPHGQRRGLIRGCRSMTHRSGEERTRVCSRKDSGALLDGPAIWKTGRYMMMTMVQTMTRARRTPSQSQFRGGLCAVMCPTMRQTREKILIWQDISVDNFAGKWLWCACAWGRRTHKRSCRMVRRLRTPLASEDIHVTRP